MTITIPTNIMQATSQSWITRCPSCKTAFRVTLEHLEAARGSVRCGSCLQIFKAIDHLSGPALPSELIDRISSRSIPGKTGSKKSSGNTQKHKSTTSKKTPPPSQAKKHNALEVTEFSASSLKQTQSPTPYSSHAQESSPDEDWAHTMLKELEQETREQAVKADTQNQEKPFPKEVDKQHVANPANDKLESIADEPLKLHYDTGSRRRKIIIWSALNVLAVLALLGQYVISEFDSFAKGQARPVFATICQITGCQLPDMIDTDLISASNLVVRSLPEYDNTLAIDAIITNQASFQQPFPLLRLTLSDEQGQRVAQRDFHPKEYLSGELSGQLTMPSRQPIHMALKILDPGSTARNYQLSFIASGNKP